MNRVLSIDQSSDDFGVGRSLYNYEDEPIYDVEAFKVIVPKGTPPELRCAAVLDFWRGWLRTELLHCYDLVVCEDYARVFANGIINHKVLGIIELACYRANVSLIKINPKTVKLYATGNGDASKEQMIMAALAACEIEYTDDAADAYWMLDIANHIVNKTKTGSAVKDQIIDTLSRTPEQIKADKRNAQLAKAAATIAADEAKKTKALVAQLRSEARAQRQAEAQRKREEKAAKKEAVLL